MKKRNIANINCTPIAVDIKALCAMLSIGESSARRIGKDAGAVVKIGARTLYKVEKVQQYIDGLMEV